MTDEEIIELAESLHISMRSRAMSLKDEGDGMGRIVIDRDIHYAGKRIIELARIIESKVLASATSNCKGIK